MKKSFKFIVALMALMVCSVFCFTACEKLPQFTPTFTLDKTSMELTVDELQSLTLTIANIDEEPVWTSSNPEVATVIEGESPNQVTVKGIKEGGAVITVEAGEFIQVCPVTVKAGPYITVDPETLELFEGRTGTITVDTNITTALTYTSQNPQIATVNNDGLVTAVAEGTTDIVVSGGNKTATCKVVVTAPYVTLDQSQILLALNGENTYQLTADSNGEVEWQSSNESVATVSESGLVTAVSSGEAIITASFLSAEQTCTVKVKDAIITVTLSDTEKTLESGTSFVLTATLDPEQTGDDAKVTYEIISGENIVSIDEDGNVTSLGVYGEAVIRVTSVKDTEAYADCTVTVPDPEQPVAPVVLTLNYVESYNGAYMHFIVSEFVTTNRATVNGTDTIHNEWSTADDEVHLKIHVGNLKLAKYEFAFYNDGVLVASATYTQEVNEEPEQPGENVITLEYVSKDQFRMQFKITNAPAAYNYVKVNGIQYDSKIQDGTFDVYVGDTTLEEYVFVFVLDGQDIATVTYTQEVEEPNPTPTPDPDPEQPAVPVVLTLSHVENYGDAYMHFIVSEFVTTNRATVNGTDTIHNEWSTADDEVHLKIHVVDLKLEKYEFAFYNNGVLVATATYTQEVKDEPEQPDVAVVTLTWQQTYGGNNEYFYFTLSQAVTANTVTVNGTPVSWIEFDGINLRVLVGDTTLAKYEFAFYNNETLVATATYTQEVKDEPEQPEGNAITLEYTGVHDGVWMTFKIANAPAAYNYVKVNGIQTASSITNGIFDVNVGNTGLEEYVFVFVLDGQDIATVTYTQEVEEPNPTPTPDPDPEQPDVAVVTLTWQQTYGGNNEYFYFTLSQAVTANTVTVNETPVSWIEFDGINLRVLVGDTTLAKYEFAFYNDGVLVATATYTQEVKEEPEQPAVPVVLTLNHVENYGDAYMHFIVSEFVTTNRATVNGTDTIHNEWFTADDGVHLKIHVGDLKLEKYEFAFYNNGVLVATATYTQEVKEEPEQPEGNVITLNYVTSYNDYWMKFESSNLLQYGYVKVNGQQVASEMFQGGDGVITFNVYVGDTTLTKYEFEFYNGADLLATATYRVAGQVEPEPTPNPDPEQPGEGEKTDAVTFTYEYNWINYMVTEVVSGFNYANISSVYLDGQQMTNYSCGGDWGMIFKSGLSKGQHTVRLIDNTGAEVSLTFTY